jgi:hypothetical protein
MNLRKTMVLGALEAMLLATNLPAQEAAPTLEEFERRGYSAVVVTPVFSQLVAVGVPRGFRPVSEGSTATAYLLSYVPQGESTDKWTQKIQVIGAKDAANRDQLFPDQYLTRFGNLFRSSCPQSFEYLSLGRFEASGHQAVGVLLGCGVQETSQSEVALVIVVKGRSDLYTIQWAERREAQEKPTFDQELWKARFLSLWPTVCDRVPDEAPPYPSCLNRALAR